MTDPLPMIEHALSAAEQMARQDDRFAFFTTLICASCIIGANVMWGARYLVRQNNQLITALNQAHGEHSTELKAIVEKLAVDMRDATEARVAQTEVLRATAEVMRDATDELRLHRNLRPAGAPPGGHPA
jgi:hypothetical protein